MLNSSLIVPVRNRLASFLLLGGALLPFACSDTPTTVPYAPQPDLEPEASLGDPRLAFVSDREGWAYIYVADADGSNVTRLVRGEQPDWSPDGRRIVFVRGERIYRMNFDGSGVRDLGAGIEPTWSPEGTIAFYTEDRIMAMDALGSSRRTIFIPGVGNEAEDDCRPVAVLGPTWAPNGLQIAFLGSRTYYSSESCGASVKVYVLDVGDGKLHDLAPVVDLGASFGDWDPRAAPLRWSPDGSRIAGAMYDPSASYESVIASFRSASGEREILSRGQFIGGFDWSPDGQHIVFDGSSAGPSPGGSSEPGRRIFELTLETGAVRQLIPDVAEPVRSRYGDYDPAWTPHDP